MKVAFRGRALIRTYQTREMDYEIAVDYVRAVPFRRNF